MQNQHRYSGLIVDWSMTAAVWSPGRMARRSSRARGLKVEAILHQGLGPHGALEL